MGRLSLSLLGPFQVAVNGKPVIGFESDRVRALLAYLAVEADRPHRRERLAGLFWPDWPDRSALTNLRNALSNLRKTIGDRKNPIPVLLVDRESIQFNLASDSSVDTHLFKTLTASDQPILSFEKGIGLYRGSFLEGFGLKDSAPFEEWSQMIREQMQRQCLTALEKLTDHYETHGDLEKAREFAWKQIDLAPWHEEAQRNLMRLLALSGQRSTALAQYETCRHMLQQELGVAPSPETVALYESIRDGKIVELGVENQPVVPQSISSRPTIWPTWLTPYISRRDISEELLGRLKDTNCRLLTLVGPGGSGKTRLAVEAVAELSNIFPQGIYFVSLASLQSAENMVAALAQVLNFSFREQEEPLPQLLHYLRKKALLLILDNFEHLINDADAERENGVEIVTQLLGTAPEIKILVTSRVGLNVQGEYLMPIPSMGFPEQTLANLSEALEYGAVQLFLQEARRVRPGFEPNEDDLTQVIQICRLVQGMPLGILLAAAWMRMLSPTEIATQLAAHKLDFLEVEWHNLPERQRSMRVVFDYSWQLLSERERQILMALSVFRGGFTYAAAQLVAMVPSSPTTLRDLLSLINSSMLQRTASGRYEMHELLRQYAEEKSFKTFDADQAIRDRHAIYFTTALKQWVLEFEGPRQQDALAKLDIENDNVRAAWSWAVKHDRVDRLADGMKGVGAFWDWRARYKEGEKAFRTLAEKLAALGLVQSPEQLKTRASALAWQARFNQRLGRIDQAREEAHQSLALLNESALTGQDVRWERALALEVIGEIEIQFGNCQDGKAPLSQSLVLYRKLDERRSIANCLRSLGRLFERMGNYVQAMELHRESVDICRSIGAKRDTVDALLDLIIDLRCLGQNEESDRLLKESFAIAHELGDLATITAVRYRMGAVLLETQATEGLELLEECVAIYTELGDRHRWALALMRVGEARLYLGQYDQALSSLQDSLAWYRQVDNWWGIGAVLRLLAELALVEDKIENAWRLLEESLMAFRRNGARSDAGWTLSTLGVTAAVSGDLDRAQQYLADAMHIALKFRHQFMPKYVLLGQAILAAKQGQAEHALRFWLLLSAMYEFTPPCIYQDLYRKHIAPVTETLSFDQVKAVQERRQSSDVWTTLEELVAELRE